MILYEYPFNEKIRSFLRLEFLFNQLFYFQKQSGAETHEAFLRILFEVMAFCDRGDIRTGLLQELERQKKSLHEFRQHPQADVDVIDGMIKEVTTVTQDLHNCPKPGHVARQCEWLAKIKNRFYVPGGLSPMEFPAYHAWLSSDEPGRQRMFDNWLGSFSPLYRGIEKLLQLIRQSRPAESVTTPATGVYERELSGQAFQLIRVWVPKGQSVYPEVSANKYVAYVRLYHLAKDLEANLVTTPTQFRIAFCNF